MQIKRYSQYSLEESLVDDFISSFNDLLIESNDVDNTNEIQQQIISRFKERFGETVPSNQEFADFYHKLRSEGIDGILIFDTLDFFLKEPEEKSGTGTFADSYKRVEKKVLSDLRLDTKLALTFGAGIGAMYPIVSKLMQNMNINSIEVTTETTVLLTIAALTIVYLEEKKDLAIEEREKLTKDSKSMLEELRMRSIGDGIVKKIIKAIGSIKNIFSILGRHIGAVIGGIIDMFSYTSILIPIMNGILFLIGKYEMTPDTIVQNFFSLGMGVASKIAKHGLVELISKLKNRLNINKDKVLGEIETPVIQRFSNYVDQEPEQDGDLIKEQ